MDQLTKCPNLCCVLSPQIVCLECGMSICRTCAAGTPFSGPNDGPVFHERKKQCLNGANLFTIVSEAYIFWKKGNCKAPVDDAGWTPQL